MTTRIEAHDSALSEASEGAATSAWTTQADLPSTLPAMIRRAAQQFPERAAIIDGPVTIGYADLLVRSQAVAASLIALGVESGDRVAIWAPNMHEWILAACGIHAAGAVLVPLNTRMKGAEAADKQARLRSLRDLDGAAMLLHAMGLLVLTDDALPLNEWRDVLFERLPRPDIEAAMSKVEAIAKPADMVHRPSAAGRPVWCVELRIVDDEDNELPRDGANRPAMWIVDNAPPGGRPGTVAHRFIISKYHRNALGNGGWSAKYDWDFPRMSNFEFNATVILGETSFPGGPEVLYNCGMRKGGSPWTRSGWPLRARPRRTWPGATGRW